MTFGINVKGLLFTVQKALPLLPRRRLDHPQRVDRCPQRHARIQRLQRHQGGRALVRAHLDHGSEGPQDSRQRRQPGSDRDAGSVTRPGAKSRNSSRR